ncbi:anti-sigma-D factor RsdA [Micromonospora sp. KC723]|uniref:anti-sigma-D factor RsdA n=1 Tax=Micromonospora sp. KC723 TaxID=2530381 RepID=UPI00104B017F|nr:anti-sigma-D factor RsdA [Micromonospora sp. KC723]TDB76753.1 hypothetical protein E1165_05680 [Micromonospora sp. KC723]
MREHRPDGGEELDLATIARDDRLLDALGRGEPVPAGDDLASMLAAWHADLGADPQEAPPAVDPWAATPAATPARLGGRFLRVAAAVVALAALAVGLGVASRTAGPGSPLWSLTRVLYPGQAEVRSVEDSLVRARAAVDSGQLDNARQLVDRARGDLPAIDDPATTARLGAELDAVHRDLLEALSTRSPGVPSAGIPTPGPTLTREPAPGGTTPKLTSPAPSPTPGGRTPLPDGGSLPLPTLLPPSGAPTLLPVLPGLPPSAGDLPG